MLGLWLGLNVVPELPLGPLRSFAAFAYVFLAGGALGFLGLYIGFEFAVLNSRLMNPHSNSKR